MAKSTQISRNEFVKGVIGILGTIMGAIIGIPAISYVLSPALKSRSSEAWIAAGPLENYTVGIPTPFNFTRTTINGWEKTTNSYGVFILRKNDTEISVFSNVCTHLSCRVSWRDDSQEYVCPCHDGRFSKDGGIISGPQPRPLDVYGYKIEEGNLLIHFLES
jgi:menaquinol-cytochrome c reductase iron-sulfur subunit